MLTFRKPNGEGNDQRDRYEFEINNPQYPPKIPPGEWVDDVRNNKWAWAKPLIAATNGPPVAPQPAVNPTREVLDTFQVFSDISERIEEKHRPPAETKPTADPIEQAIKIMNMMKGGGETVLLQMMSDQLKASQARTEKLEDELRAQMRPAANGTTDPLEVLDKQAAMFERFKKLFGKEEEGPVETALRRSKMPWIAEFFAPMLPEAMKVLQPLAGRSCSKDDATVPAPCPSANSADDSTATAASTASQWSGAATTAART